MFFGVCFRKQTSYKSIFRDKMRSPRVQESWGPGVLGPEDPDEGEIIKFSLTLLRLSCCHGLDTGLWWRFLGTDGGTSSPLFHFPSTNLQFSAGWTLFKAAVGH